MIVKQVYQEVQSGRSRARKLESWECRCDEPDWCGCGKCHRCGRWLRRRYDPETCADTIPQKSRFRKIPDFKFGSADKRIKALDDLFKQYADEVQKGDLTLTSKSIYIDHARNFVRWLHGDFKPGSRGAWGRAKYPKESEHI